MKAHTLILSRLLDSVGINAYFPLDFPVDASVEELEEDVWGRWMEEIKKAS